MLKGLKKHEDKEQGKAKHEAPRSINYKVTQNKKPEDQWSCIAHLSTEDMLKSAVIEEMKFERSS